MIKYNICLIKRGSEILLLNREKASWMGCWNGVGGKLEKGESPRDSMQRELKEETGITSAKLQFKGLITWSSKGKVTGGMYVYLAELPEDYSYPVPVKTDEGILDWKQLSWILHPDNQGIASNLPVTLPAILTEKFIYNHRCEYEGDEITAYKPEVMDPAVEWDEAIREAYIEVMMGESVEVPDMSI